jgi:O-antigen ligase
MELYEASLNMINQYVLSGNNPSHFDSGTGTFKKISQFEVGDTLSVWQSWAHNDYLKFFLNFGIPGIIIIFIIALSVFLNIYTYLYL